VRLSEFLTFARLPSIAASDNLLLLAVVDTVKDILVRLADSTVQAAFAIPCSLSKHRIELCWIES